MSTKTFTEEKDSYGNSVNIGKKVHKLLTEKHVGVNDFAIKMGRKGYSSAQYMLEQEDWKLSDLNKACEILGVSITEFIPMPDTTISANMVQEQAGPYGRIAMLEQQLESCKRESKLKDELISVLKNK
jgi:hypothetical protein